MVRLPFVVVTVALPHEAQVRLTPPFVSVAVKLVALMFEAVMSPLVSVRIRLDALMLETWRFPFTVTIWTVLNWYEAGSYTWMSTL